MSRMCVQQLLFADAGAGATRRRGRAARCQSPAPSGEWRTWGGDLANTRYRSFDQINASNFGTLDVAWRFKTDHLGPRPEFNFKATPLMVNGVVYTTAGSRRAADR